MHTRLLLGGFVLLACTCILLTGSRSGFIGLCAAALLTLLFFSRNKARVVLLAGGGGVLALLLLTLALPTELQHRYLTLIDSSYGPKNAQVSAEGRIDGLIAGVQAWQRSPVIGHGPGAFTFATGRDLQAHNLYGQVLSEVGVLGVLGLLGLLYCFWHNTFEATRLAPHARGRARPFAALVSRCIALDILLLLLLGCAGHNLYRYQWQWFAAFQVIALHCLRTQPLAQVARTSPGYLVHRRGPHWVPLQG
jgi:O-antigen ligase